MNFSGDVVVCGGGTAGAFAAIAAARQGAKTLLLEKQCSLGGSAGAGLVTPRMSVGIPGEPQCSSIAAEVDSIGSGNYFDPLRLEMRLEELCADAGVELVYDATVYRADRQAEQITGAEVFSIGQTHKVAAREWIDCTGDGSFSVLAGAEYDRGDPRTGANQPMSLRYMVGGVDLKKLGSFLDSFSAPGSARSGEPYYRIYGAVTSSGTWALTPLFREAVEAGELTAQDAAYWQMFGVPGRPDTLAMNHPEFFCYTDACSAVQRTKVILEGRRAIKRQMEFYRKHFPGCENAYVSQVAQMPGIRESRRIRTEYTLSGEDLYCMRKFPDAVAQSRYPVDIHGEKLQNGSLPEIDRERPWYEVPYRSLCVRGIDNLLVAGRCIGADFIAQSAIRIQPTCRSTGEAAGIAAAWAAKDNCRVNQLDGAAIAAQMRRAGARFAE